MVGLEGNRDKKNARLIGQTANECSSELEQKEKEIERKLLIAEKDKRETMYSLDCIKKLTDQFQALVDDFKLDVNRDEISLDFSLPPSVIDTIERRRNSMHGTGMTTMNGMNANAMTTIESNNDSPNGSPNRPAHFYSLHTSHSPNHSPSSSNNHSSLSSNNHFMHSPLSSVSAIENYTEQLKAKEAELKRVTMRAQQESAKATFFRKRKDDLQQRLSTEVDSRRNTIKLTKQNIAYKEKEISRLSFLAEQDKKTGMFLCQQIAQLKKSIEGFLQAREESKPETLCNILTRCASSSGFYTSPPSSPLHNSSYLRSSSSSIMRTALGRETEALLIEDDKKTQELARVKCIVEQESKRVDSLKVKVAELKQGLVAELQEADEQLEQKMQEFVQKQLAIEKVQARAERERARSLFLKNEIINLGNALGVGIGRTKKGKGDEYAPDVAYLSEFSDLCDLETSAVEPTPETLKDGEVPTTPTLSSSSSLSSSTSSSASTHASSLPLSIATNLRTRDPSMYVFSPPCRTIPISPASEGIYMQKLKDIAVLNRETTKKDEELARLKRLAEAERCRHLLLKDKFDQLHQDLRDRQLGHTY